MGIFGNLLLHFDIEPEGVDAECNNCQEKPFYPMTEKTNSWPCKLQAVAIDDGVFSLPRLHDTDRPRCTDTKRKESDSPGYNTISDVIS